MILFFSGKAETEIFTADKNSNTILPTANLSLVDEVWKSYDSKENITSITNILHCLKF